MSPDSLAATAPTDELSASEEGDDMTVSVRYIVDNVEAASAFYRQQLGFELKSQATSRSGNPIALFEPASG